MIDDEYQPYDRSSKWLIQHHGDSMLWLAQIKDLEAWRPAQAQVVQPTQIPDGLLEARRRGQPRDDLVLLEAATYPERRVVRQMTRDLMLVYLDQSELPEAVAYLLAVIQVFTFLRYNDEGLLTILGGKDVMLKVPLLDEIVKEKTQEAACETARENLVTVLEARFGNVPRDLTDEIGSIGDAKQLKSLVRSAVACPDLDAFRDALAPR